MHWKRVAAEDNMQQGPLLLPISPILHQLWNKKLDKQNWRNHGIIYAY